jgi:HEPN domain-containing protein
MAGPDDLPKVLLDLAGEDELVAKSLLPLEGVTDRPLGFHAQQAVEKALKAVLAINGVEFPYSHDLNGLLGLCRKHKIDVPEDLSEVGRLSVFAVRLRYDAGPAAHLERDRALKWAAIAVAWARTTVEETERHKQADADDLGQAPGSPS